LVRVQLVLMPDEVCESWTVVDDRYAVVGPAEDFLAHLAAIERSPTTVRSYAFDLRDYFCFLDRHGLDWAATQLADLGRFVAWLRLPPPARSGAASVFPTADPRYSAATINRKLSAVTAFYEFHARHGVDCAKLLVTVKPASVRGAWRPFLAHPAATSAARPSSSSPSGASHGP
jgi:integrase/recombinase XerD